MWWVTDQARFLREIEEIAAMKAAISWLLRTDWKIEDFVAKVEFDFQVGDRTYEAVLTFPAMFPDVPAYVMPKKPGEFWSTHQYGGSDGVLCLQWGPDNWQPKVTGAMLIQSTYDLMQGEADVAGEPREVPSRHHLTVGQRTRSAAWRLLVTQGLQGALAALPNGVQRAAKFSSTNHDSEWMHSCTEIFDGEVKVFEDDSIPKPLKTSGLINIYKDDGWVFASASFDFSKDTSSPDEVLEMVRAGGFSDFTWPSAGTADKPARHLLLLVKSASEVRGFYVWLTPEKSWAKSIAAIETRPADANRVPADREEMRGKTVGLAGLGSAGTKTAKSLVRQGIRKLILIDDDVFLPENVERNDLDWLYVGIGKAEALKEALSFIAANVKVEIFNLRIGGQENAKSASTTLDILAKCDLIVDATANPKAFNYLAGVAQRHKIRMVWGEVFAGGIGCLIARSRPGIDPCPNSTRAQILKYLEDKPKAPFQAADNYDVDADDGTTLVATDGEVGQFAYMLTRLAIDALRDQAKQEFPYSAYLVGFKKKWIFTAPFHTQPIETAIIPELEPETKPADEATQQRWRETVLAILKPADADAKDPA